MWIRVVSVYGCMGDRGRLCAWGRVHGYGCIEEGSGVVECGGGEVVWCGV